jgi:hypothetical protein
MTRLLITSLSILLLLACNNSSPDREKGNLSNVPKTKSDSLYQDVMKGHERGMGRFGELHRYETLLSKIVDSLARLTGKSPESIAFRSEIDSALSHLKNAENAMNQWMEEFDPNKEGKTENEKIDFYSAEKDKVNKVEELINNSLDQAKKLTNK